MKIFSYTLALFLLFAVAAKMQAQSVKDTVSREDKFYALSMIWKEADYNFVFFNAQPHLNWDSLYMAYIPKILATRNVYEYVKVLTKFIGTLKDGHTGIMLSQFYWNETDIPPVNYMTNNGKRYVTSVEEHLKDQIPVGAQITRLNGKTWDDYLNGPDLENNDWRGFTNTTLELTLLSKDNKESKVVVTRNLNTLYRAKKLKMVPGGVVSAHPNFDYKSLSANTAYVDLRTFEDSSVVDEFKKALPEIRKHRALIVDVRNNGGGNDDYALQIAEYLTDQPFIVGSMWKTRIHNAAKKAWAVQGDTSLEGYLHRNVWEKHPGDTTRIPASLQRLNMPVYILTSRRTFSAAEDFLIYLNYSKNVTRIGQATGGSSGQPLVFNLPHGISARVCAKADEFPDGTDFINIGIKPQIAVGPSLGEGMDAELDKALAIIDGKK
ncbi:MAG: S41 family peptidase [Mucilaginibacter sp.]